MQREWGADGSSSVLGTNRGFLNHLFLNKIKSLRLWRKRDYKGSDLHWIQCDLKLSRFKPSTFLVN